MENEYDYERIESFLEGGLQGEELILFEQELKQNKELNSGLEWAKAIREGVRKQWATQTADKVIASLSEVNCAFIISFIKNLKTHINYGFWDYKL